jgi:hypothetical protein
MTPAQRSCAADPFGSCCLATVNPAIHGGYGENLHVCHESAVRAPSVRRRDRDNHRRMSRGVRIIGTGGIPAAGPGIRDRGSEIAVRAGLVFDSEQHDGV